VNNRRSTKHTRYASANGVSRARDCFSIEEHWTRSPRAEFRISNYWRPYPIIAEAFRSASFCANLAWSEQGQTRALKLGTMSPVLVIGRQLAYQKGEPRPFRTGAEFSLYCQLAIGGSAVCLSLTQRLKGRETSLLTWFWLTSAVRKGSREGSGPSASRAASPTRASPAGIQTQPLTLQETGPTKRTVGVFKAGAFNRPRQYSGPGSVPGTLMRF
jgi:hypothetical protein